MSEFTASNGLTVAIDQDGDFVIRDSRGRNMLESCPWLDEHDMQALREFFVKENDDRLGRWRWPENPTFVVYPPREGMSAAGDRCDLFIVNEEWGDSLEYLQDEESSYDEEETPFVAAAQAYRAAHPEPKPWHDAKPGEVWIVRFDTDSKFGEEAVIVPHTGWDSNLDVVSATRIWPEVQS